MANKFRAPINEKGRAEPRTGREDMREEEATPFLICPQLWWDVTSPVANGEPADTHRGL
ncbi:La-related protein 1 [Clarias magur]|uniref:La-related protein 1 n=1 Tax=Clarias magur TaxID=1594786 RepID=A0A8J4X0X9_CLAMG|nr:La-related protein 1 [Clarias magur]